MVYAAGAARPGRLHLAISLSRVTSVLALLVGALAGLIAILFAWAFVILAEGSDPTAVGALTAIVDPAADLMGWALMLASVSYLLWLYRTVRRASRLLAVGAVMSPAAAVFFAVFLVPYGAIRDLYAGLAADDRSLGGHLVAVWWIAWVANLIFTGIFGWLLTLEQPAGPGPQLLAGLGALYCLVFMTTAGLTAWIVRVISEGEGRMARVAAEMASRDWEPHPFSSRPPNPFIQDDSHVDGWR